MESTAALEALSALSHATRLEAFRLLVRHAPDGLAAGVVAETLAVPANTLSVHLAALSRAGLVSADRQGRQIIYRAETDSLRDLILFLVNDCCQGRADLCRPLVDDLLPACA